MNINDMSGVSIYTKHSTTEMPRDKGIETGMTQVIKETEPTRNLESDLVPNP